MGLKDLIKDRAEITITVETPLTEGLKGKTVRIKVDNADAKDLLFGAEALVANIAKKFGVDYGDIILMMVSNHGA